jgi:AcrR family transcriptional regulator
VARKGTYSKGSSRREEILATALRVITENGYHKTTLRGIGRELGAEPSHILYYFDSREHLLREVIERWDAGSWAETDVDSTDTLALLVAAIRRNVARHGIVHLYLAFAIEAVDADHPAHEFFRQRFDALSDELAALLQAGKDGGLVRADVNPRLAGRMLIALADGLQLQALIDPEVDAPADLEYAIDDLFVAGVRTSIPYTREAVAAPMD